VEHTRSRERIHLEPGKVVIVEGILIFENEPLLKLMDIKVYIDTDDDLRFIRRLLRDVKERGRNLDSVIDQYVNTAKPMHNRFVEPSKRKADIIIPNNGEFNNVAVSMLIDKVRTILSR
jgi:uridine kinase